MMQDAAADAPLIEAVGLSRRYGARLAVEDVSFRGRRGEIFGCLGPNGAGESTTTRMLTGFIKPSGGISRVAGYDIAENPVGARQHIGVEPEEANVYADMSFWQNVMLMTELHGVGRRELERRTSELPDQFGIADRRAQKGRTLSKGLRQRLMICTALVSAPEILFLDEPTSSLDVANAHPIREVVTRLNRERGMAVFITTHTMEEVGDLCHRIAIIDNGRLAVVDTPQNLRGAVDSRRSVEVRFDAGPVTPAAVLDCPA